MNQPYYPPRAKTVPTPTPVSVLAIVKVSLPPSLPSVSVTLVPATNLPFKTPAVVSFDDTLTAPTLAAADVAEAAASVADEAAALTLVVRSINVIQLAVSVSNEVVEVCAV